MSEKLPFVSIIIPCRDERAEIEHCLTSALAQKYPRDKLEVIVAEGGSCDGTRQLLEKMAAADARLRIVENAGRIVSTGLNVAIRAARGLVIVRMDAHTEYAEDYVACCVQALVSTAAENVGGAARTKPSEGMARAIALAYHSSFAVGGARFHDIDYEGYLDTVTYGCWKRELFDRVGFFDEELVRNQDDEHNLRITRAGGKIWQSRSIRSWYRPRASLRALFRQYAQYGYWKVRVIQKHRLPASLRHLVPGGFVMALICLALLAPWSRTAALFLAGLTAIYASCVFMAALLAGRGEGWKMKARLAPVFAAYHFGYGYGFLRGFADFVLLRRGQNKRFSASTRNVLQPNGAGPV